MAASEANLIAQILFYLWSYIFYSSVDLIYPELTQIPWGEVMLAFTKLG